MKETKVNDLSKNLILASVSPFRRQLLENAGLSFSCEASKVDERAIDKTLENTGITPFDVALVLAEAKALAVSERFDDAVVIGCDQTLSINDRIFHKPKNMEEARNNLLEMAGKSHDLNSAVVLAKNGKVIWKSVVTAHMTMRNYSPKFVGQYLAKMGEVAFTSVGAYQFEGLGIQLFEKVEGDYFTIIGLPLLPLLNALRDHEIIES